MYEELSIENIRTIIKEILSQLSKDDEDNNEFDFNSYSFSKKRFLEQLKFKLNIKVEIPIQSLWEYPSIELFANYIYMVIINKNQSFKEYVSSGKLQSHQPIAIVGIGCNFPGKVTNIDQFWNLLQSGLDPISEIPAERWNAQRFYDQDYKAPGKMNSIYGGFLDDVGYFDAAFFNISPIEAKQMDPQQRLFLETSWQALEQGGIVPNSLSQTATGVFVGVSMNDYEKLLLKHGLPQDIDAYSNLGSAFSAIGARLAYFIGLNGPSFAIDTACSSSLSALYQACLSLRSGDCEMAIAGGVNLILDPDATIGYSQAKMLAPDGRCKTFDERANGYVRSEGCGVIVLKHLDKALADNDNVLAIIKSSFANQDGSSNGITAPNMQAQAQMLKSALYCADLSPDDIDVFETHGTGTYIGDPIEVDAINQIYTTNTRNKPLYLGALKSQIGHCEAAAGIAGVIKSVLTLIKQEIPSNLHFENLNPSIDINQVPCEIPTKLLKAGKREIRHIAVSSYGFTGTNTHVILERAPNTSAKIEKNKLPKEHLFVLSAKSEFSLNQSIAKNMSYLQETKDALSDICYTEAMGRTHFRYRIACVIKDKSELINKLQKFKSVKEVDLSNEIFSSTQLSELQQAYLAGKIIDFKRYYAPYIEHLNKLSIPTYQFDRYYYWLELKSKLDTLSQANLHPLLGTLLPGYSKETRFINSMNLKSNDYFKGHRIFDYYILPAAAYIESAIAASIVDYGSIALQLLNMNFDKPLEFENDKTIDYQVSLLDATDTIQGNVFAGHSNSKWEKYAQFTLNPQLDKSYDAIDIARLKSNLSKQNVNKLYSSFHNAGLHYSGEFQSITEIYHDGNEIVVKIEKQAIDLSYYVHPVLLDGAFQAVMLFGDNELEHPFLPVSFKQCNWYDKIRNTMWAHIIRHELTPNELSADICCYDENGILQLEIIEYRAKKATEKIFRRMLAPPNNFGIYTEDYNVLELPQVDYTSFNETIYCYGRRQELEQLLSIDKCFEAMTLKQPVDYSDKSILIIYHDFNELIELTKQLIHQPAKRIILVTCHGIAINMSDRIEPEHARAVGYWKCFTHEYGLTGIYHIDLDNLRQLIKIIALIQGGELEPSVILREKCYAPRLTTLADYNKSQSYLSNPMLHQKLSHKIGVDSLVWNNNEPQSLAADEIEIEIKATALNYRDILKIMQLYTGEAGPLGVECSGVVRAVGAEVRDFTIGDRVSALSIKQGLFGLSTQLKASHVVKIPNSISYIDAATTPLVYTTVYNALCQLAKLKEGQSALIHAASGGVGLAAIELLNLLGVTVYTTASAKKHDHLKKLGVKYIYDSRNLDFAEQLMRDTDNQGVNCILNSLTDEGFIEASLNCLKPNGVFVELASLNIYTPEQIKTHRNDVDYHIIEMDKLIEQTPRQVASLLQKIYELMDDGKLSPLPSTVYPVTQLKSAFNGLQHAQVIGKVVVVNPKLKAYQQDATYLITGGTGGLGLELAKHLIAQGVNHIILASRSPLSNKIRTWIADNASVDIQHVVMDVSDINQVKLFFDKIANSNFPLQGIFHTAGVVKDGLLNNLSIDDFDFVSAPKVKGSLNLHECSKQLPLDYFVLFSSITSLIGNIGQTNYGAANGFMDGLARYRRKNNLPALTLHFGPFADVGMAKSMTSEHVKQGWIPLNTKQVFAQLEQWLLDDRDSLCIAQLNCNKLHQKEHPYLSYLVQEVNNNDGELVKLLNVTDEEKKEAILTSKLKAALADVLRIQNSSDIQNDKEFREMGIDSLLAVDLKNRIQSILGDSIQLQTNFVFEYSTIIKMVKKISRDFKS